MKLILLLSVGLGLTWTLQDDTLDASVLQGFDPEQVMLWGLWIRQGVTLCLQLFFQVSITLQSLDGKSQLWGPKE